MAADLRRHSRAAASLFDDASAHLGFDLGALCESGPADELQATVNAQPALYTASCAALEALRAVAPVAPMAVAGHSVGEYAALYACGSLGFVDGLALVHRRAVLMHAAASKSEGAMTAVIGLDVDVVRGCCEQAGGAVAVANINCPGQIVISGVRAQVADAAVRCKESGAKLVVPLAVSGGFHSSLMEEAGAAFQEALTHVRIEDPKVPFVANVTGRYCRTGADIRELLAAQISSPVLWEPSMRRLLQDGMTCLLELGVGSVLSGLMKRTDRSVRCLPVEDGPSLRSAAELLSATDDLEGGLR